MVELLWGAGRIFVEYLARTQGPGTVLFVTSPSFSDDVVDHFAKPAASLFIGKVGPGRKGDELDGVRDEVVTRGTFPPRPAPLIFAFTGSVVPVPPKNRAKP